MFASIDKKRFWLNALLATVAAAPLCLAQPVLAQDESDVDEAETASDERIVVTARRREESLLDVPAAVTAYTGDQLETLGAQDLTFLNQTIPNATIERSRATNSTITAFIRGVGQQDPVVGFEQGVGIYIDDVYLNRPQGILLDIYDVERIEVLRGPQGTLYGRNTIGGAIKYVTRRLGDEPEFKLRVAGGTFNQIDAVGSFGLPIAEGLAVGGTVAYFSRDGFGENLFQRGIDNYDKEVVGGRVSVEWSPTNNLFFRVAGDWTKDTSNPRHGHRLIDSQFTPGFSVLDDVFDTRANLVGPPEAEVINRGLSFLAEWQVHENITIKNIIGYRDNESGQQIDFDSLPVADLESPFALEDDQFSEELQILFDTDYFAGIFGFYYLDAESFNVFDVLLFETGDLIGLPGLNAFTLGRSETQSWSIFGDVTFDLAEVFGLSGPYMSGLELSVGGRYTSDERTGRVLRETLLGRSSFFGGDPTLVATATDFEGNETFTDFNPRISLAWMPTDDQNLYFSYSEGFKGGSFDPRGDARATPDFNNDGQITDDEIERFFRFEPEEITSYELGLKSSWAGGRLNTNIAAFYSDYTNIQIPGSIGVDSDGDGQTDGFAGVTTNAGAATIWGVELEGSALIAEDFGLADDRLSAVFSVGYINAEFDEFIIFVTDPVTGETGPLDVADERNVQNTPNWTANLTWTYSVPLDFYDVDGELSLINAYSYRGDTNQFEFDSPIDQEAYWLVDASLVWTSDNGRWQVGVHGRNLTNELYKVAGYDFFTIPAPIGLEGNLTAFFGDPRTVTGVVEVNF